MAVESPAAITSSSPVWGVVLPLRLTFSSRARRGHLLLRLAMLFLQHWLSPSARPLARHLHQARFDWFVPEYYALRGLSVCFLRCVLAQIL